MGANIVEHYSLHGTYNQCIMNIGSNLENVRQVLEGCPVDQEAVAQTVNELTEALKQVPSEQAGKAQEVTDLAKGMADEVAKADPNRSVLSVSKDGMIEAAQTLAVVVPSVLPLAKQLAELICGAS